MSGPVPVLLTIAGVAACVFLLARRPRWWWRRALPLAVGASAALVLVAYLVLRVWQPFPDTLPTTVLLWSGFGVLGLALGAAQLVSAGRWRRVGAVLAVLLVVAVAALQVNAVYGYRPTLRAVLGLPGADEVDFSAVAPPTPLVPVPPGGPPAGPLWQTWRAPPGMPTAGVVTQVDIPGTASRFTARPAAVYLPPAYLSSSRPSLPVLVLISGQPGSPRDWVVAGRLATTMDAYAAAHAGLTPIVVVPDGTGTPLANPLCMDSALGNVETYLARDVPDWLHQHLQVDPDTAHWAIGGFSYGGTCALQMALRRPALFPTFLDVSGQLEPTLGNRARTVRAAFGGDEAKFRAVNPLDELAAGRYPGSAGILASGTKDGQSGRGFQRLLAPARKAGIDVRVVSVPGAHSWTIAADALHSALPWLAPRAGLAHGG